MTNKATWTTTVFDKSGKPIVARQTDIDLDVRDEEAVQPSVDRLLAFAHQAGGDVDQARTLAHEIQQAGSAVGVFVDSMRQARSVYEAEKAGRGLERVARYISELRSAREGPAE